MPALHSSLHGPQRAWGAWSTPVGLATRPSAWPGTGETRQRFVPLNQPCHVLAGSRFCHSPPLQHARRREWGSRHEADLVTGHPGLLRERDACSSPAPSPWQPMHGTPLSLGATAPTPSPAWVWGHMHPACSRTGALLAASSPRCMPESSSCAASAHPHTHSVPSPCSSGSHACIILGAVPRHATAPSVPGLPVPRGSFSPLCCTPEQQDTRPLNGGTLRNSAISQPAGTRNMSASCSSATCGAPPAAHGDAGSLPEGQAHARGSRQYRHRAEASVWAGCSDAGLTSTGTGHSRTPPSRLPRFLLPHLHHGLCSPIPWDGSSRGALALGPRIGMPCSLGRDAPASHGLFPSPFSPLASVPPTSRYYTSFMWPPANRSGHAPPGLKKSGNKSQPIAMPAAAPAWPH